MSRKMQQLRPQLKASTSEPQRLIQLGRSQAPQKNYTESLRSIAGQITTFTEGWKSKIRTSSTKQVTGMFRGAIQAKVNRNISRPLINKFLTQNSKGAANNRSKCQRQSKTNHCTSSMKARNTIKGRTGTKTKNQSSGGSIVSFMEKTKGTSPKIAQMRRKLRRGQKAGKTLNLRHNNPPGKPTTPSLCLHSSHIAQST